LKIKQIKNLVTFELHLSLSIKITLVSSFRRLNCSITITKKNPQSSNTLFERSSVPDGRVKTTNKLEAGADTFTVDDWCIENAIKKTGLFTVVPGWIERRLPYRHPLVPFWVEKLILPLRTPHPVNLVSGTAMARSRMRVSSLPFCLEKPPNKFLEIQTTISMTQEISIEDSKAVSYNRKNRVSNDILKS
jgi:hypothetical protein